jgi:hypothetical protein
MYPPKIATNETRTLLDTIETNMFAIYIFFLELCMSPSAKPSELCVKLTSISGGLGQSLARFPAFPKNIQRSKS